ncbi:MAG: methionine--tRNA ligase [Candidatus Omnitrophica bacterium]|nr:methionine--tRNA ligase [Candidatus Omnitrophota bacterium]
MSKTLYFTTPLYYVNAAPHIGHSYTTIAADALARYYRLKGESVFLLTGTDEHGQKIEQAAAAAGKTPQVYVDDVVERFLELWKLLNISYDDFIRTTQPRHEKAVQAILTKLYDEKKLVHAEYQGWYCTPDETFWTEAELAATGRVDGKPLCPSCQRALEPVQEDGWHLPLRASQDWLRNFVKTHPDFVKPASRYNELASLLEQPLPESLCITRPRQRVSWGIPVPFSPDHVTYVWIDALLNYITVAGYLENPKRFDALWPAAMHVIGKDILRHHALYWPVLLHALGLPDAQMPKTIFAHGWWKVGEQKMSKTLGNIVDPTAVVTQLLKDQPYAADIYRYFLLREIPFGQDGSFSEDALFKRLDADLANDLGNLVNRTCSMLERYCQGVIPQADGVGASSDDAALWTAAQQVSSAVDASMSRVDFSGALEAIMAVVTQTNQYIERTAPWKLAKQPESVRRLHVVLVTMASVVRALAAQLQPFMPSVADAMWEQLGYTGVSHTADPTLVTASWPSAHPIGAHPVLFPRAKVG